MQDSATGPDNFSAAPLFWLEAAGNLHLSTGSPCIDAGDPQGAPGPDGSLADVGAFVYAAAYIPPPVSYCEAGVHLGGCASELRTHGSPTLTGPDDFELHATDLPNRT